MNARHVMGIDPSLTHTAGHYLAPPGEVRFSVKSKPDQHAHAAARLDAIAIALESEIGASESAHGGPGLLVVEGYAYGAANSREALGEWGGQIRRIGYTRGWRVLVVPPTTLKKYVTGKGVAEKDMMMMEVFKRWKYEPTDNNDADAYALLRLGMDYLAWERGEPTTKALAEMFAVKPKVQKTEKKKAQKQKGLVVWEPKGECV